MVFQYHCFSNEDMANVREINATDVAPLPASGQWFELEVSNSDEARFNEVWAPQGYVAKWERAILGTTLCAAKYIRTDGFKMCYNVGKGNKPHEVKGVYCEGRERISHAVGYATLMHEPVVV